MVGEKEEEKPPRLTVEILDKIIILTSTGFGLVAALPGMTLLNCFLKILSGHRKRFGQCLVMLFL